MIPKKKFQLKAKVWLYPGVQAAWHFLTLPKKDSKKIKQLFGDMAAGWGSLPVTVTIGNTVWQTSIFPDKKRGSYLLPLKADVRKKEKIVEGGTVSFIIEIRV